MPAHTALALELALLPLLTGIGPRPQCESARPGLAARCDGMDQSPVYFPDSLHIEHIEHRGAALTLVFGLTPEGVADLSAFQNENFPIKYLPDFYSALFTEGHFLVRLFEGDSLMGAASARVEDVAYICHATETIAYLMTIAVAPRARARGLGTVLLERVERWAAGCRALVLDLHVLASNAEAIQFYHKRAYTLIASLPEHYHFDGAAHDALQLSKVITVAAPQGWLLALIERFIGRI